MSVSPVTPLLSIEPGHCRQAVRALSPVAR